MSSRRRRFGAALVLSALALVACTPPEVDDLAATGPPVDAAAVGAALVDAAAVRAQSDVGAALVEHDRQTAAAAAAAEAARQAAVEAARRRAARAATVHAASTPPAATGSTTAAVGEPSDAEFDRLARCESGGRWNLNTGNGYFGGLQFDAQTWRANGGTGLPHEHSRETQIEVGRRTWRARGWAPWPTCRRTARLG